MRKFVPIIVILGCAAVFAFGMVQLFKLRFDVGDVYPPYSSLRSDPLGTMALYESINKLPGVSTRRDVSADNRLPESADTTYMHLAADTYEWRWMPEDTFYEVDRFVRGGGRLVITLFPESSTNMFMYERDYETGTNAAGSGKTNAAPSQKTNGVPTQKTNATPLEKVNSKDKKDQKDVKGQTGTKDTKQSKAKKKKPVNEEDEFFKTVSIEEKWGVGFDIIDLVKNEKDVYEPVRVRNQTDLPLPQTLDWHSGIVLTNSNKAWRTIYSRGTNAVVVERKFGRGSVVIATDSYFTSNEAMVKDRHADFLAWVIGASKTVVFDEAHLGVMESSGVSALMRKYRLYWLVGGLILLAVLFIWKNSLSLLPPRDDERHSEYLAGKGAASGFVNLLRRNLALRELLGICFVEWKKSAAQSGMYSAARVKEAETIFHVENSLTGRERNPLRAYHDISTALNAKHEPLNTKPKTTA